ncbi:MAG: alpha-glucosidase [Spirochaetota bacterium]
MEWWKKAVIYQIYPRSFQDSNGDGVGDLRGIIQRLDYLKGGTNSLGVDAIWLSPINVSPMADFGYDVSDYREIDPIFGDIATFQELIAEAKKRDIKIIMDLVINHTSDQHPWFQESRQSRDSEKRDWYIWHPGKGKKAPNNWLSAFGGSAWTLDEQTGEYYYHAFGPEQPDLNWRNPQVQEAVFSIVRYWSEMGVYGYRLDVVNCFVKDEELRENPTRFFWGIRAMRRYDRETHIYDRNRPELHTILKRLNQVLAEQGEKMTVGEVFQEPPGTAELPASYYGDPDDELSLTFNFSFFFANWSPRKFREIITAWEKALGEDRWPCYVLSNHDFDRHSSRFSGFWSKKTQERAKLAAILLLTQRGTPFLYYGEELGMQSQSVVRKLLQDPVGKRYWPFYKGRDNARLPMCWNGDKNSGFTEAEPWLPLDKNWQSIHAEKQMQDETSLWRTYQTLINLRQKKSSILKGKTEFLDIPSIRVLAYTRTWEEEKVLILLNFYSRKEKLASSISGIFSGEIIYATDCQKIGQTLDVEQLELQPYEGIVVAL